MTGTERPEPRAACNDFFAMESVPIIEDLFESGTRSVLTHERDATRSKVMPKIPGIQYPGLIRHI
ncbi:MAG TPA: hypothetical protein VET30_08455 [Pseudoxanthomonas sp.]|nr:hypothetical protein [Pseudoxanthomonas sp.]